MPRFRKTPKTASTPALEPAVQTWEDRWEQLSDEARQTLLKYRNSFADRTMYGSYYAPPGHQPREYLGGTLAELRNAGFLLLKIDPRTKTERVTLAPVATPFITWLGTVQYAHHLRDPRRHSYSYHIFIQGITEARKTLLKRLAKRSDVNDSSLEFTIQHHITNHRWPVWVAEDSRLEGATEIVAALFKRKELLPLVDLANAFPHVDPPRLKAIVAALRNGMALFEELDAKTGRIRLGLLSATRESHALAAKRPARRPALEPRPVASLGPSEGTLIPDLRAFLIELVRQPGRLKQDGSFYQKEEERIEA